MDFAERPPSVTFSDMNEKEDMLLSRLRISPAANKHINMLKPYNPHEAVSGLFELSTKGVLTHLLQGEAEGC